MVVLELSMFPLDKGESLSPYVARLLDVIDSSGLEYRCGPMATVIEGPYDQVMDVVKRCFEALEADCGRIEGVIRFDYRRGASGRIDGKVQSVERCLGRPVKK